MADTAQVEKVYPHRQGDFSGGEIAPVSYNKTDARAYQFGLRTALNFLATLEGQLLNRPGTRFIVEVKDSATTPTLTDFAFSDTQTFVLEIGDGYIRFIHNGAQVMNGAVPYEVWAPWAIADVPYLQWAQDGDIITFDCLNPVTGTQYAPQELTRVSNTNWTLAAASYVPQAYFGTYLVTPAGVNSGPVQISNLFLQPKNAVLPEFWQAGHIYDSAHLALFTRADGTTAQYISTTNANTGNSPEANTNWWVLHSMQSTNTPSGNDVAGGTQPTWANGDFVFYYGKLYVSLADGNNAHDSNGGGPSFVVNQTNWWAQADDESHLARTISIQVTQLWKDSNGVTHETLPSVSFTPPTPGGKFPLATDRLPTYQWGAPNNIAAPTGYVLDGHNVFRGKAGGVFGLIGSTDASTFSFQDDGSAADFGTQPPRGTNPFDYATGQATKTQSYPGTVTYHEQRILQGRTGKQPQRCIGSAIGDAHRFDINTPVQDSDSFDFKAASTELEDIRRMLSLRHLLIFTGTSVFNAYGPSGSITPTGIIIRRASKNGSSFLRPLALDQIGLYYTDVGRVRDLIWDWRTDNYQGHDVSVIARHMFDSRTVVDWAYAQHPWSIIYAVRDDGTLLALTYSTGIEAWTRITTKGRFERVASVEEVDSVSGVIENAVYVVVRRVVNGTVKRYIERFSSRLMPQTQTESTDDGTLSFDDDVRRCNFLDCSLEFDGRQAALGWAQALSINSVSTPGSSDPTDYEASDQITVTALLGATPFTAAMVGTAQMVLDPDDTLGGGTVTARIVGYTSASVVTCELDGGLTQDQVNHWIGGGTPWGIAVTVLTDLGHLEGKSVTVLADGAPDGPFTVAGGQVTLTSPTVIAQVGLSYNSDMELLDVAETQVKVNFKSVRRVFFEVVSSRGILAGETLTGKLTSPQLRPVSSAPGLPPLFTGYADVYIRSTWNERGGRACLRQSDPLPLTVTAVTRELVLGGR